MIKKVVHRFLTLFLCVLMIGMLLPVEALADNALDIGIEGLLLSHDDSNYWKLDNSSKEITGSVKSVSGCDSSESKTSTLTITNNKADEATLSFNYAVTPSGGTINVAEKSVTETGSYSYSARIPAGENITITITSGSTEESTTITITNISLLVDTTATTTFEPAETGGTYTVDGESITEKTIIERSSRTPYNLSATPNPGYKFAGWYEITDSGRIVLSKELAYSVQFDSNKTITAIFILEDSAIFSVGRTEFFDLNEACTFATTASQTTVTLVEDGTLHAGNYTIPAGVTLLIPFDAAGTAGGASPAPYNTSDGGYNSSSDKPTKFRCLTLSEDAEITVQTGGAVEVGGRRYSSSMPRTSMPAGAYGQIYMRAGSSITLQSGANLYAWGYITGAGTVTAQSGAAVYEMFQVSGWRGGTVTGNMKDNDEKVFPFYNYYVQNIEAKLIVCPGAAEKAVFGIMAGLTNKSDCSTTFKFLGANGLFSSDADIVREYDSSTGKMIYTLSGNAGLNAISVSVQSIGIESGEYVLPINGYLQLNIASGTVTINNDVALLPGAVVNVASGAALNVASGASLYLYDKDDWKTDYEYGEQRAMYSPSCNGQPPVNTKPDAKIDVNGNIIVNGAMYTTEGGADICSSEGTGVYKQEAAPGTATKTYQYNQGTSKYIEIPITPAKLHNDAAYYSGDLAYTETATAGSGDTIDYILGMWGGTPATVTFNANGGTGTMEAQQITSFNTPLDACTFTRLGYTFAGWNTSSDGTGTKYDNLQEISPKSDDSLILYAQWTVNTYTITVKSDANGSPIADVSLDGPGTGYKITEWGSDKQITIIAPEKQGFTFKGWYKSGSNYSEAAWNTDLVVKKSLTDLLAAGMADDKNVISLVAVYESKEETNLTLTLNNAPDNTSVAGEGVTQTGDSGNVWRVPVGTEVTINVPNGTNFRYWTNANDKVMSKDPTYTFTMVTNTTLTAETNDGTSTTFVIFQSADGRLLSAQSNLNSLTLPAAPYRVGYEFKGWSIDGAAPVQAADLPSKLKDQSGIVTVTAAYTEAAGTSYNVTAKQAVNGVVGAAISGEKSTYALGEIATFTAPDSANGSSFRFWASNKDGTNILSFSQTYSFRVTKNTEIYAIYGETVTDRPPVVRVDDVLAKNENSVKSLTFMIGASIPSDYELVEMGALYTKDANSGTDAQLRVENVSSANSVYKAVSRLNHETARDLADFSYALGFKISENNASSTICLRGYVAVKKAGDSADSTIYYYYSGVHSASYQNLIGTNS